MSQYLVIIYGQTCGDTWLQPQLCIRTYADRETDTETYYAANGRDFYVYIYETSAYVQYDVLEEDAGLTTYWMETRQQDHALKIEEDRTDIVTDYRTAYKNIGLDMKLMTKTQYSKKPV